MELGNVLKNLCDDSYVEVRSKKRGVLFSGYVQHCTLLEDFKVKCVVFDDDIVNIVLVSKDDRLEVSV